MAGEYTGRRGVLLEERAELFRELEHAFNCHELAAVQDALRARRDPDLALRRQAVLRPEGPLRGRARVQQPCGDGVWVGEAWEVRRPADDDHVVVAGWIGRCRRPPVVGGLGDDKVCVRATEAETRYRSGPRAFARWPIPPLGWDGDRARLELECGGRSVEAVLGRGCRVLEREQDLDER